MILQIDGKPLKTLHPSPHKTALGAVSPIGRSPPYIMIYSDILGTSPVIASLSC